MSNLVSVEQLVERSKQITAQKPPNHPFISEFSEQGYTPFKLLIIACADPRCVPEHIFGLKFCEAAVFRNPGGHVRDSLPGLIAIDQLVGGFEEVLIVHHTDCGTSLYTDPGMREMIRKATGTKRSLEDVAFGGVGGENVDMLQSVRDDLAVLKEEPLVRQALKDKAVGYLYDVKTGSLTKVED